MAAREQKQRLEQHVPEALLDILRSMWSGHLNSIQVADVVRAMQRGRRPLPAELTTLPLVGHVSLSGEGYEGHEIIQAAYVVWAERMAAGKSVLSHASRGNRKGYSGTLYVTMCSFQFLTGFLPADSLEPRGLPFAERKVLIKINARKKFGVERSEWGPKLRVK
eukprot:3761941-Prymnesium_polylepis.1